MTLIDSDQKPADISPGESETMHYMPQLDTVRTLAVTIVLIAHWVSEGNFLQYIPLGMFGVTLFFVLSGFLITQILLKGKLISEEDQTGNRHLLKQFYARRTLRIFPIYYITIFILLIFNIENIRSIFMWFLLYASNIYFFSIQNWVGNLSHLWTLAVEEQFYIIWPLLILFTPRKYLFKVICGAILFGPLFRAVMFLLSDRSDTSALMIHILTPACIDCFALGALLAYYRVFVDKKFQFNSSGAYIFLALNVASIVTLLFFEESVISMFLFRFNVSILFLMLISKASIGFTGILKTIFENKFLRYLGKISYGIYLFHKFMPGIYRSLSFPPINNLVLKFTVYFGMTLIVSSVSWYIIEKPINNLKRFFKYG